VKLVTAKLSEAQIDGLDKLVRMELYRSRSAAIRAAIRDLLKRELWEAAPLYEVGGKGKAGW
jgi:Arc/MetJ-type ribon-helix-helix transcriptional regulator